MLTTTLIVSNIVLWLLFLFLAFLLLGALRAHSVLNWKLEELEATTRLHLHGKLFGFIRGANERFRMPYFTLDQKTQVRLVEWACLA